MKFIKSHFAFIIILFALVSMQACKAKKIIQKPAPATETTKAVPVEQPKPQPVAETKPVTPVAKPEFNANNVKIQFEFDSSILKTASYPVLDQVASEIKANPSVNYALNSYASIEGTEEHNQALSQDRANSVKTYLVNDGVSAANIKAIGYGTSNPVADNSTDEGRILNRRVEVRKLN
jgi:OOP family OmpA-OmpF porin